MNKEEEFLKCIIKIEESLKQAEEILDYGYNMRNYIINKDYNRYSIKRIFDLRFKLECLKNGWYVEQNKKVKRGVCMSFEQLQKLKELCDMLHIGTIAEIYEMYVANKQENETIFETLERILKENNNK